MDVHCCNCGEPWDQDYLRHDLDDHDPDDLLHEGWKFGRNRLVVLHCPGCPKDGSSLPDAPDRAEITEMLAELLGDDQDGLASTLEDFDLLDFSNPAQMDKPKFALGYVVATPGILDKIPETDRRCALDRHSRGDWGDLDPHDVQENERALRTSGRLLSAYQSRSGTKFWIITEGDRSATTLLLPEEY